MLKCKQMREMNLNNQRDITMKWLSVIDNGLPMVTAAANTGNNDRVLTYSPVYKNEELIFRVMDIQFVKMRNEVTDYSYLTQPES
jgi:hypothetical protein